MIECPSCDGGGLELDADDEQTEEPCARCDGSGWIDGADHRADIEAERAVDDARNGLD